VPAISVAAGQSCLCLRAKKMTRSIGFGTKPNQFCRNELDHCAQAIGFAAGLPVRQVNFPTSPSKGR